MFAVLKTGGKQYKVASGDVLRIEKLAANAGDIVQFNDVLMVGGAIGTPFVAGAGVQAEVIDQIKGEKLINFVKRRRKHSSKRTKGHRQKLTLIRVTEILESGADTSGVMAAIGSGSAPAVKPTDETTAETTAAKPVKAGKVAKADAAEKPAKASVKATATAAADADGAAPKKRSAPKAAKPKE